MLSEMLAGKKGRIGLRPCEEVKVVNAGGLTNDVDRLAGTGEAPTEAGILSPLYTDGHFGMVNGFQRIKLNQTIGFRSGEMMRVASVAAWICSTVNSGLYSVRTRPLSVTTMTPISVMIMLVHLTAV